MTLNQYWTDNYRINSYEVDARGNMPIYSLGKFMQETAYNHAKHLSFGFKDLQDKNLFWVLSRLIIKIEQFPRWLDTIKIRTWPSGVEKLLAFRDFEIMDQNSTPIGRAGSAWLILDSEKRRPQRMTMLQEKIHLFPDNVTPSVEPAKLTDPENPQNHPPFDVRYSDLDLYNHVNNAKYMQWIMDSYPRELHDKYRITTFEINFLSETRLGDQVYVQTEQIDPSSDKPVYQHSIRNQFNHRALCRVRVAWTKQAPFHAPEPEYKHPIGNSED